MPRSLTIPGCCDSIRRLVRRYRLPSTGHAAKDFTEPLVDKALED
jgi:hypothetical protein